MTVGEAGERAVIAHIRARVPAAPPFVVIGIGDDAAVVEPARNRVDVVTTDAAVEGVHFDRRFMEPRAIGHRLLAANLKLAGDQELKSIAFPAISTGVYGFPLERATWIAVREVQKCTSEETSIVHVVFACFDSRALDVYQQILSQTSAAGS